MRLRSESCAQRQLPGAFNHLSTEEEIEDWSKGKFPAKSEKVKLMENGVHLKVLRASPVAQR